LSFFFKYVFFFFSFSANNLLVLLDNFYFKIFNGRMDWIDLLIKIFHMKMENGNGKNFLFFLGFGNATTIYPKLFYKIL
jgi:hypothetical protein